MTVIECTLRDLKRWNIENKTMLESLLTFDSKEHDNIRYEQSDFEITALTEQ